jgi:hypothetical protein
VPVPFFLLFLCFRKATQKILSELDETKAEPPIFPKVNTYYTGKIPHAMEPVGSFWWKDVCKLMPIFRGIASSSIKDGTSTLFWKDAWLDQINAEAFPRAFSFAQDEDVSIHQFLFASRLADSFHLPISPEAMDEVRSIQELKPYSTM